MKQWHTLSIDETRNALTSIATEKHGANRLDDKKELRWYNLLARQFQGLLILILIIAAALSFFIGDKLDAMAIFAVILLNALLGFIQEWKAENTLNNLKKMLAPRCRVIRDGHEQDINAETLILGDHVLLTAGSAVPADIRLTDVTELKADESALTGESMPVRKQTETLPENTGISGRNNIVWMGTHIVNGHGTGLVVATGMKTEFGRIAKLTGGIEETMTPLQTRLNGLARQLSALALLSSFAVVIIGLLGGKSMIDMMMTGISLAVAAIPEGLPAVVTITLALGSGMMARKKALLRNLQAAETLGAVSVICTDKTGTLTKNEMTVQKIWLHDGQIDVSGAGYAPIGQFSRDGHIFDPQTLPDLNALLRTGYICNHARIIKEGDTWRAIGSATEAALIVTAKKAGIVHNPSSSIITEYPFNSSRKRMSVIEKAGDSSFVAHVKGAPEVLLPLCGRIMTGSGEKEMTHDMRRQIIDAYTGFSRDGLRTLALARKSISSTIGIDEISTESELVFLGVVGVTDPPRPEVFAALTKAKQAGIRVIVITGDSPETATTIAREIGLSVTRAVTSAEIKNLTDAELSLLLKEDILFARAVPEDKFRIVSLLQKLGHLTAMTGDGVNDAPALKQSDVGIAMGIRGTDVARGAADIVLMDDNFASIISAIEEGRRQYANIQKFVRFLTAHNIGEVLAIFFNIVLGGPLILIPIQILWINLVTDTVTALSLSVEKAEKNIMHKLPRTADHAILGKSSVMLLAMTGLYVGLATLGLFQFYLGTSYAIANTVALTTTVISAQILVFSFRCLDGPISSIGWFSNPWLLVAITTQIGLQVTAVYVPAFQKILHTAPLTGANWCLILLVSLPLFIAPEIYKTLKQKAVTNEN